MSTPDQAFVTYVTLGIALLSGLTGLASAVVAVFAMRAARIQAEETRRMRETQTSPQVLVSLQPREEWISLLDLVIENQGQGAALNIRLRSDPDFEYLDGMFLSNLGIFKHGISFLSPKQTVRFFLTNLMQVPNSLAPHRRAGREFTVHVSFSDDFGNHYERKNSVNLNEFENLSQLGEPPLYAIAKSLDKLQRSLDDVAKGRRWVSVRPRLRRQFAPPLRENLVRSVRDQLARVQSHGKQWLHRLSFR